MTRPDSNIATRRALLVLGATLAIVGAACSKDKTKAQAIPGSIRANPSATVRAARGGSLALDGASICDTLARLVQVPTLYVVGVSRDSELPDPMSDRPGWRRGCGVHMADTTDTTGAPMEDFENFLVAAKWIYATHFSADGPDGEVFAYAGAGKLCVFRGSWDGGDDSDTTYVSAPGYELRIACAPTEPSDTAGYGETHAMEIRAYEPVPQRAISGAIACPVPDGCGIKPPMIPPAAMIDLQHLMSLARLQSATWPSTPPLPLVDTVAKHGRAIARAIAAMLPSDSTTAVEWSLHVEQQLELTLCAIYDVKPEAGKTVWGAKASQAENRAVRQYWRDRVRSGS